MKIKRLIILIILVLPIFSSLVAQEKITVNFINEPLNQLVTGLRDSFYLKVSFNNSKLSEYNVTLNGSFQSPQDVLEAAIERSPFKIEKFGSINVIVLKPEPVLALGDKSVLINGAVVDKLSGEFLPFSTVQINGVLRITDFRGRFSYKGFAGDSLHLAASHLGYYLYDTIMPTVIQIKCELLPANMALNELLVEGKEVEYAAQTGNDVGEVRLNQKMAEFIPGGLSNSLINILKLQAGINGSVEHAQNLSIWGSSAGQNQARFDGITIYNLNSLSDNFNAVNPLLIKDINIYKGGFGSNKGNRIGGIIDINGIDGNYHKPSAEVYVDNRSFNAMASIPLFKRSAMVVGHRRSILNTYNNNLLAEIADFSGDEFADFYVQPETAFQDLNAKFSAFFDNGDQLFISAFNSRANNLMGFTQAFESSTLVFNQNQTMRQTGLSAYFGKLWKNGIASNFKFIYSGYKTHRKETLSASPELFVYTEQPMEQTFNQIDEMSVTLDNRFSLTREQFVETGIELNRYNTYFNYAFQGYQEIEQDRVLDKASIYVRNNIQANTRFKMDIGLRLDYNLTHNQILFQPRLRSSVTIWDALKLNLTWGVYNQFISMSSVFDPEGNIRYFWDVGGDGKPVLQSDILGGGISWNRQGILVNAELYYRRTEGMQRYVMYPAFYEYSSGLSRTQGFDLFIKKDFNRHTIWFSYTHNNSEEHFDTYPEDAFRPTYNLLKNEFKAAAIFNFDPIYFSSNYVFGTGFNPQLQERLSEERPYARIDASLYYKSNYSDLSFKVGINALNILNRKNYPYISQKSLTLINEENIIYTTAYQPFYTMFFVSISY